MTNVFDTVVSFFLGQPPAEQHANTLYYLARLLVGLFIFDQMFDLFRLARRLVPFK